MVVSFLRATDTVFSLQIPLTPLQPLSERPASPSPNAAEGPATSLSLGHCAGQREVGAEGTAACVLLAEAPLKFVTSLREGCFLGRLPSRMAE